MKPQEAIEIVERMNKGDPTPEQKEALEIVYAATEKQIGKKVKTRKFKCDGKERYVCPSCQCLIHPTDSEVVCRFCGQIIDWSDEIEAGKVFLV